MGVSKTKTNKEGNQGLQPKAQAEAEAEARAEARAEIQQGDTTSLGRARYSSGLN